MADFELQTRIRTRRGKQFALRQLTNTQRQFASLSVIVTAASCHLVVLRLRFLAHSLHLSNSQPNTPGAVLYTCAASIDRTHNTNSLYKTIHHA